MINMIKNILYCEINSVVEFTNKNVRKLFLVSIFKQIAASFLSLCLISLLLINLLSTNLANVNIFNFNIILSLLSVLSLLSIYLCYKSVSIKKVNESSINRPPSMIPEVIELVTILFDKYQETQEKKAKSETTTIDKDSKVSTNEKIHDLALAITELNVKIDSKTKQFS